MRNSTTLSIKYAVCDIDRLNSRLSGYKCCHLFLHSKDTEGQIWWCRWTAQNIFPISSTVCPNVTPLRHISLQRLGEIEFGP